MRGFRNYCHGAIVALLMTNTTSPLDYEMEIFVL